MSLNKLISLRDPKSPVSEAYRTLRTNLEFSSFNKKLRSISVTSPGPGEGKTTTISNLATAMAQTNQKVLLIDGDLRRPQIHKLFDLTNYVGLTNILAQHLELEKVVKKSQIAGLDILTSGPKPPNPSEILGCNTMRGFIEDLSNKYDKILIDSPPIGVVTDGAVLATVVDGTILVVLAGKTHIEEAQRAKQILQNVNANILGVLLNKVPVGGGSYYNYYLDENEKDYGDMRTT